MAPGFVRRGGAGLHGASRLLSKREHYNGDVSAAFAAAPMQVVLIKGVTGDIAAP